MQFHVQGVDGNVYGPATLDQLRAWIQEGRITPDTMVSVDGGPWQTAKTTPGLAEIFGGASAPPPPPAAPPPGAPPPGAPPSGGIPGGPAPTDPPKKKSNLAVILLGLTLFTCITCGIVGAAVLFPVFSQAKEAAKKTRAITSMKNLGMATIIYLADNNDRFPPEMETAVAAEYYLQPYAKDRSIFESVHDESQILGNDFLSNRESSQINAPNEVIMFYDEKPFGKDYAVVRVDGSAVMAKGKAELDAGLAAK